MLSALPDNDQMETQDLEVQHACSENILKASEDGCLLGKEAPIYDCHTFAPTDHGDLYAQALTRQLNHFAEPLGLLGFQVNYRQDRQPSDSSASAKAYFEVRVFARGEPET